LSQKTKNTRHMPELKKIAADLGDLLNVRQSNTVNKVRVNTICSGAIKALMPHAGVADDPIVTECLKSMILMGYMARPQEITEALLFLDSDYWCSLPVESGQAAIWYKFELK
jgi:NAD(P)-dependent dehydrogenase (short-subunit alcohol dehydrogenase family)